MIVEENGSLAPFTTLRIGGSARFLVHVESEADLLDAVAFARGRSLPLFVVGGGSNLVVPDEGYSGAVLLMRIPEQIVPNEKESVAGESAVFDVSAGTDWDRLVLYLCERGICGMECLAGIPGLVGGSPIQNIGAYGQEVSQTIESVRALDLERLAIVALTREQCEFRYRSSLFNSTARDRFIVTSVRFRLPLQGVPSLSYADLASLRGKNPSALEVYHAVRAIRARKGMLLDAANVGPESRSAGSFFKNPVVAESCLPAIAAAVRLDTGDVPHWKLPGTELQGGEIKLPAAWLIEHAGFPKGYVLNSGDPVGISPLHTLALVNRTGTARCADLLRLRDHIVDGVFARFAITLEQEPVTLR